MSEETASLRQLSEVLFPFLHFETGLNPPQQPPPPRPARSIPAQFPGLALAGSLPLRPWEPGYIPPRLPEQRIFPRRRTTRIIEAKGSSLDRFMREFEAEYKVTRSDHIAALAALVTPRMGKGSNSVYISNRRQHVAVLLDTLPTYERYEVLLAQRREYFDSAMRMHMPRGGEHVESWFEEYDEKLRKALKNLKIALRRWRIANGRRHE